MDISRALRLYVIPDREIGAPRTILEQTTEALRGGATTIQLRDKELAGRELLELACALAELCRKAGAMFIVNDRLDIAMLSGAHGVHVGQDDLPVDAVRRICPPDFIVGVSVQTREQAIAAKKQGADYFGIGAVVHTSTKDEAAALGLEGVKAVAQTTDLPSVAIGGINLDNVRDVMKTGVQGISLISAIVGVDDICARTKEFLQLIDE